MDIVTTQFFQVYVTYAETDKESIPRYVMMDLKEIQLVVHQTAYQFFLVLLVLEETYLLLILAIQFAGTE